MTDKGKKSKSEKEKSQKPEEESTKPDPAAKEVTPAAGKKDSAKPDPAPKKAPRPAEKAEVIPPEESLSPTFELSPKSKKEKKSSGLLGVVIFLFLIIAGGIGAGGYYLYQEQMKFQNETIAKLSQLEGQLSALDTEADQARQNKQSIDTVSQDLQQFKTEIGTTLKSHQNALTTLDEDVLRLKEKVEPPAETTLTTPSTIDDGTNPESALVTGELLPGSTDEEAPEASEDVEAEEKDQESQAFVDWMENFFAAIWNWFAGLFS